MNIGTRCPVPSIEYIDGDGKRQVISCYFESGQNQGKSKGLAVLAKELGLELPIRCKLSELQNLLAAHPAFAIVSFDKSKNTLLMITSI
jgi:hypothetical protein